jgi:hypothetical protein
LASGIHTNLSLEEATKLAVLASQVPEENIRQGVVGADYVVFGRSPDNLSILIPIPDKIHVLRDEIFASSGALSPLTAGSAQEKMQAENARVSIQNGTQSSELSARSGDYLKSLGVNVVGAVDAAESASLTTIIDHTGKPYVLKYLVDLMKISPFKIVSDYNPNSPVDVEVILGNDWAASNIPCLNYSRRPHPERSRRIGGHLTTAASGARCTLAGRGSTALQIRTGVERDALPASEAGGN